MGTMLNPSGECRRFRPTLTEKGTRTEYSFPIMWRRITWASSQTTHATIATAKTATIRLTMLKSYASV